MIAELIQAYTVWLISAAVVCLGLVAGWNHFRALL